MADTTVPTANAAAVTFAGNSLAGALFDLASIAVALEWQLLAIEDGEIEPQAAAHSVGRVVRRLRVALDELACPLADCQVTATNPKVVTLLAQALGVPAPVGAGTPGGACGHSSSGASAGVIPTQ